jgi:hypothetical protein
MTCVVTTPDRTKRPPRKKRAERRRTELGAILDAMMWEALDAAMREEAGAPQGRQQREHSLPEAPRKKIEIYSAGCRMCREVEAMIRRIVGFNHDIEVLDMRRVRVAEQAARLGIRSVPGVVVEGQLTACCTDRGCDEAVLRAAFSALPLERDA